MSPGGWSGSRRRRFLTAWGLALLLGAGAYQIAGAAYRRLPAPAPLEELSYFPSGRHLRPATLGHAETVADLTWLRAVQYYGEHRQTDMRFTRMRQVFDILTSLSPGFVPAYVFGGFALAQEGRDVAGGERLLLQGMEANPTSGELAFELGFFYFVRPGGRDLEHAAEYFELASRLPGGPPEAARFAAYAHQNAGNLGAAYELWQRVAQTSRNRFMREMAERQMAVIRQAVEENRKDVAIKRLGVPGVAVGPAR